MPNATDFQLHIFAALAQEERRMISERTKAALAEAKKRGVTLGANRKKNLAVKNRKNAIRFAISLEPCLAPLIQSGMSLSAIAKQLNDTGVQTANGGHFHAQTIKNLISRISPQNSSDN